jgi:hypothetical protein
MVRVRKPVPTLESIFFSTPEQKVIRFLLAEPTTAFIPRVISSRLKGVRGLGGAEGITKILNEMQEIGLVDFVDNKRAVRLRDDCPTVCLLKSLAAVCDLEGLKVALIPISTRGILFGSRAEGKAASDSEYDLCVVSETPDEIEKITSRHPLGRLISLTALSLEAFAALKSENAGLAEKLERGITLWGTSW